MQKIEPTNKAAKAQIIASRNKLKSQREREKKRFANMFDKFAAEDTRFVLHPVLALYPGPLWVYTRVQQRAKWLDRMEEPMA